MSPFRSMQCRTTTNKGLKLKFTLIKTGWLTITPIHNNLFDPFALTSQVCRKKIPKRLLSTTERNLHMMVMIANGCKSSHSTPTLSDVQDIGIVVGDYSSGFW